jgi:hypothetical protein
MYHRGMPEDHPLSDRGRNLEDDYFRKKDRELLEKMRQAAAAQNARLELSTKTGLQDPELLQTLEALGFTPETVPLLFFVPLVQVAWAEGGVTDAERTLIVQLARTRGIDEGSVADRQLAAWLATRPDAATFDGARRLIRAILDTGAAAGAAFDADDLVKYCEQIAAQSGGVFGMKRVSAEERELLSALARDLRRGG